MHTWVSAVRQARTRQSRQLLRLSPVRCLRPLSQALRASSSTSSPLRDIALDEIDVASQLITERASEDANIIWGAAFDETMEDEMMVTVIATGFDGMNGEKTQKPAAPAISDADLFGNPSAPSTGSTTSAKSDDDTFSDIMSIFNRK